MEKVETEEQARVAARPGAPHFLVHNEGDHVGVAVQDVEPGRAQAVYMDSERSIEVDVLDRVPLGHKVALVGIDADAEVIEYRVPVGRARQAIRKGQLVHVHNIRSQRWQKSE